MAKKEEAQQHWKDLQEQYKKTTSIRTAWTGTGFGTAASDFNHPRQNYIWVRDTSNRPFPVLNKGKVGPRFNVPVFLGYTDTEPEIEQVLDIDHESLINEGGGGGSTIYTMGPHHAQHEWRGGDTVFIDSRQFLPGLVTPTNPPSMQVQIRGFTYYTDQWYYFPEETGTDLTSEIPSSGSGKMVLVAFDLDDQEVDYISGDEFDVEQQTWDIPLTSTCAFMHIPKPQPRHKPLGALFLSSSTTSFNWTAVTDNIYDTRLHTDRAERATLVGQIHISLDGDNFRPKLPVTDGEVGLLFDKNTGYITVV